MPDLPRIRWKVSEAPYENQDGIRQDWPAGLDVLVDGKLSRHYGFEELIEMLEEWRVIDLDTDLALTWRNDV